MVFKSLTVILGLQVLAAACDENLKIETVGGRSPALSEAYCASNPQIPGCKEFSEKPALSLGQMIPINSYQDHIVRLRGEVFTDDLKITIEGLDVPVFKISSTDAFFITPSFTSSGIKTGVLKNLDSSIEFRLYILAGKVLNPETLTEPSMVCQGTSFMLADGTVALGTKACAEITATSCSVDSGAGCTEPPFISDHSDILTNTVVTMTPTVTGASSFAWSQVSGPGVLTFAKPGAKASAVSATVDGSYVIRLSAANAAGVRVQKDILFVWDTVAPSIGDVSDILTKSLATIGPSVTGAASYAWSQVSGPGAIVFADPTANSTAAFATADGSYVIRLIAADAAGNGAQKDFNFIVDNSPPVIAMRSSLRAGMSFVLRPTVTDASPVSYSWSQLSGAGTIIFETPTAKDTLIDVSTEEPYGIYTLRLTATDALGHVATSDLQLTWDRSLVLAMGRASSCAIHPRGELKCWGRNRSSELGLGNNNLHASPTTVSLQGRSALSIAIGSAHSCVIFENGSLSCVGDNGSGQLGYGHNTPRHTPHDGLTVDLGGSQLALAISAGDSHTCALLSGGSVKCWGRNSSGQLGYGDTTDRSSPPESPVDLGAGRTALEITTLQDASCALLDDHSLKCWGANSNGQLGLGDTANRSSPPASAINFGAGLTVKKISRNTGRYHTCVILSDDSVRCWGWTYGGMLGNGIVASSSTTAPVALAAPLGGVPLQIMAGSTHTCALLSDGSVKCWGDNTLGHLGIGRMGNHTSCSDGVSPTAGSCAEQGGVWSSNYASECLNVSTSPALCEASYSCSNTTHKTEATCLGAGGSWAHGAWGHCSDWLKASEASCLGASKLWDSSKYNYCTNPGGTRSLANYCADTSSIWTWGGYCSDSTNQGKAACLAAGKTWHLNSVPGASLDFGAGKKALAVAASSLSGGNWTCALLTDLSVKCWGENSMGYLGYGDANMQSTFSAPLDLGSSRTTQKTVAGSNHTCSLLDDGTVKCWGLGTSGELGNGSFATIGVPAASSISLGQNAVNIASGYQHSCAILVDGSLKCWGINTNGQLGNGLLTLNAQPQPVGSLGASVEAVATGQQHTCAILAGGLVKCWGQHTSGQLGIGTIVTATACSDGIATTSGECTTAGGTWHANFQDCSNGNSVSENACSAISGSWASCQNGTSTSEAACSTAGKVWNPSLYGYCVGASTSCSAAGGTWGNYGYCSDFTHKNRAACGAAGRSWHVTTKPGATVDLAGTPASAIIAGTNYSCALLSNGTVKCWGANESGQIGVGDLLTSAKYATPAAPVNFGGHTVKSISPGASSVCAILDDDSLRCWGSNGSKKLGYPDISANLAAPHEISVDLGAGRSVLAVFPGFYATFTCFLASDYSLNCAGNSTISYPVTSGVLRTLDLQTSEIPISGAVGGSESICVNFLNGTVRCAVNNSVGQRGTGLPVYRSAPPSEVVTRLAP